MQEQGIKFEQSQQGLAYNNITQIHFCPMCNNLMKFVEIQGTNYHVNLSWVCPVCEYTEIFTANKIIIAEANQVKPIDYSLYKYDQSLKRCYGYCPNCKQQTELCIFYYENDSMNNGYVCTQCNQFFKN